MKWIWVSTALVMTSIYTHSIVLTTQQSTLFVSVGTFVGKYFMSWFEISRLSHVRSADYNYMYETDASDVYERWT